MRPVENAELAPFGHGIVNSPKIVVTLFGAVGSLERSYGHTLRIQTAHHLTDGSVLASGVDALQHHEQCPPALRVEHVLQDCKAFEVASETRGGGCLLRSVG